MRERKRERIKKRVSITAKDERVITVTRKFPIVLRRPLIFGLALVLVAILPWSIAAAYSYSWEGLTYVWIVIIAVFLLAYWIRTWVGWHYSVYVLTTKRIMIVRQSGLFTREVADLALNNIQNVNYKIKGLQGAMFGFGTVKIETLSGGGGFTLEYVHKPAKLQQEIMQAVHKHD
jgi:uncharacterized membrane protein YdbT with pleckstrin-like domain